MSRIVVAAVLAAGILGVVRAFVWFQASVPMVAVERYAPPPAAGDFTLEITLTFQAEPDPFDFEAVALRVRRGERILLERSEPVPAGIPVVIPELPEMKEGLNEFFLTASVPQDEPMQQHAVRVRVLRDGQPIAERTLWSEPGEPVQGAVAVDVPASATTGPAPSAGDIPGDSGLDAGADRTVREKSGGNRSGQGARQSEADER